jgi:hypothetical protein
LGGADVVQLKRVGTDTRTDTEAKHYNLQKFIPQSTKLKFCGMCRVTTSLLITAA